MPPHAAVTVVDSHTEGEPTRVVLDGYPDLGRGTLAEQVRRFRSEFDWFRTRVILEPRGSDVLVGALLLPPSRAELTAEVIFFNNRGYLGMCGHGIIGVAATLAHLGRIGPGLHTIDTPVGAVRACLHPDASVTVENVPSRRYKAAIAVEVRGYGRFAGDIAWGGNWFFLVDHHPYSLAAANTRELTALCQAIQDVLREGGITGENGEEIDHVELVAAPADAENSARNFVLCPGGAYDRSPCGTGTSAKMACLYAEGKLAKGQLWRQEGVLGTVFEGSIVPLANGEVIPSIRGRAWITAEAKLVFTDGDPFPDGIAGPE